MASLSEGTTAITTLAMQVTTATVMRIQFATLSVEGFLRTRYCTEARKLIKNSRNAVQAEGTW